jgi:response regulator RpfG family c-di-GMP phosphodiesterase
VDTRSRSTSDPISVLVVEEQPVILTFIAKVLETSGMRVLLARNGSEAVEIAERSYIPIDLVVANIAILKLDEPHLLEKLRHLRPGVRDMSMAACVDDGMIRIQLMKAGSGGESVVCDGGLVESIQRSATEPLVRRAGRVN